MLAIPSDPYPTYQWLRREAPVFSGGPFGSFVVSRYEDVLSVLKRPEIFSSTVMAPADRALLGADPPEHTRVRRIVSRAFSAQRLAGLEHAIRSTAASLINELFLDHRCDLVSGLTVPLPLTIIAELLGLEPGRRRDLKAWSEAVIQEATGVSDANRIGEIKTRAMEFDAYFRRLIDQRIKAPGNDLISALLNGKETGEALGYDETLSISKLLLIAGTETTTNLMGNCLLVFLQRPDLYARVRSEPTLLNNLIEETLRFDTPVQLIQRKTTQEVEIGSVHIPAGALVLVLLGSANRDENRFHQPEYFDLAQKRNPHLAFGAGSHVCLGAPLARREALIALEQLVLRARIIRPIDDPAQIPGVPSFQLRGPAALNVIIE